MQNEAVIATLHMDVFILKVLLVVNWIFVAYGFLLFQVFSLTISFAPSGPSKALPNFERTLSGSERDFYAVELDYAPKN